MATQYQQRQFFRREPNALLASYFEARDTNLGVAASRSAKRWAQ
ncbi:hypothetical protein [Sedimenticola selenatireducens]|nr:hypothetical protein [Sedimenticola selenatireducens]